MKSLWLPAALILVLLVGLFVVGGVRIVVTAPNYSAQLAPATLIVANAGNLNLIDSPQAFCARTGKPGNDFCAAGALAGIMQNGKMLMRLPYSELLFQMSGAPAS
ncbi:hypothetical protein G3A56_02400 [Rhizobium oryzihabitans]|uniref:Uncharacterized protein n=1 Tax=Rhizobium oryzihabitans TaxID=2267833 RepID=A0A7L5BDT1_9HYPH|nr:hypothetical protein [Rhizobium oryzihabitans]QIB36982.1 hypothetical protein G3A56_02400 [Rhizobium oryzihabitans]